MSRRRRAVRAAQRRRRNHLFMLVAAAVVVTFVAAGWIWLSDSGTAADPSAVPESADSHVDVTSEAQTAEAGSPTAAASSLASIGAVDGCKRFPRFAQSLDLSQNAAFGTSFRGIAGFALADPLANEGNGMFYQHETWDDAGYLGPWRYDRQGNIYVAPAPLASLTENPPDEQNKVYRIDTDSQEMVEIFDLSPALPASGANPFGVVGLAYDCETDYLYISSLMGSTFDQEVGRIFLVDPASGEVLEQVENVDAMGVGVFNGAQGKRLYYGLTRQPEVHSIALDEDGRFDGEPRMEISLAGLETGGNDVVRRIDFGPDHQMHLRTMDFNYTLQVASERNESRFSYAYDPAADSWILAE